MRIYSNFKEAFKETERELMEMGTIVHPQTMQDKDVTGNDAYTTKELQGYGYILTGFESLNEDFQELGGDKLYLLADFQERISPQWVNPGEAWMFRRDTWLPFLKDGKFDYTYNERIREQLGWITRELRTRPDSRQAVLTIYDRHQDMSNMGGKARIPCSMYYQFLIRERRGVKVLDIIYTMRSCDLYTHFIYDVFLAAMLGGHIAFNLGLDRGYLTHFMGSLHAYKKDYDERGVF